MNLQDLRREYIQDDLDVDKLDPDPVRQFSRWFEDAKSAGMLEPNAMSLATATSGGETSIRTVLCKGFDAKGFMFFTNLESTKARQISENPKVSLLFPWLLLERQVIINGAAEKLSLMEVAKYFVTRPLGSQLAAWASPQSSIVTTRKVLEMKFEEMRRKFADGKVPVPDHWGGYRVIPRTIEFWQGRPSRLHDRFLYQLQTDGQWTIKRLAP